MALTIAVPLCALSYIVPTLAALAANGDWQDWGESHYMKAAAAIGGPALGAAMAAGGLVSNAGILTVTILGQSRLPMVLADDGLFPPVFRKVHPRFGTPVASLVLSGVVLTALCGFRFAQLAGVYSLVQSLSYLLIYAALFRLRGRPALGEASGFRIPLGTAGLVAMALPSVFLVSLVVRQGIWPGGVFDARQALLDLAIFASGPLTYLFIRRFSSARRVAVAAGALALSLLVPGPLSAQPESIRVGMDTRSRPWAYVPGLDYSKEDWTKPPLIQPAQLKLLEGIDIDILNALARRMGVSYRIVPQAWESIEEGLIGRAIRRADERLGPQRQDPEGPSSLPLPTTTGGSWWWCASSDTQIGSYRDLAGKRVGHFKDRVVDRSVQSLNAGALVGLEDSDAALRRAPRLEAGRGRRGLDLRPLAGGPRLPLPRGGRALEPPRLPPRPAPGGSQPSTRRSRPPSRTSWARASSTRSVAAGKNRRREVHAGERSRWAASPRTGPGRAPRRRGHGRGRGRNRGVARHAAAHPLQRRPSHRPPDGDAALRVSWPRRERSPSW